MSSVDIGQSLQHFRLVFLDVSQVVFPGGNGSRRRQSPSQRSYGLDEDRDGLKAKDHHLLQVLRIPQNELSLLATFRNQNPERFQTTKRCGRYLMKKILDEVEALLKEGMEGLQGRIKVGVAERMLYEAAELCEKAVELR